MTICLLTTEEVAVRFRTSPATVRYWRHVGIGPSGIKVGRRVLYDEAECDRWWRPRSPRRDAAPAEEKGSGFPVPADVPLGMPSGMQAPSAAAGTIRLVAPRRRGVSRE